MARIAGVDLPNDKRIEIALTYIYGIGRATARKILDSAGVSGSIRVKNLTDEDTGQLRNIIEREYKVEGALRSEVAMNIKRLMDIGAYRGLRHRRGPAGARPAHQDQRAHPQGSEEDRRRDEAHRRQARAQEVTVEEVPSG